MSKNKRKKTLIISTNTSTTTNENNITNNSENQTLIAEIPEQEEKWEWQHDTPENHNIDIAAFLAFIGN